MKGDRSRPRGRRRVKKPGRSYDFSAHEKVVDRTTSIEERRSKRAAIELYVDGKISDLMLGPSDWGRGWRVAFSEMIQFYRELGADREARICVSLMNNFDEEFGWYGV